MLVGTPDPSIEMTIGKGPAPLGVVIVELSVIEVEPWVTTTVSLPPEKVAVSVAGGAPFGPDPQYWIERADLGAPTAPLVAGGDAGAAGHQERVGQIRDGRQAR